MAKQDLTQGIDASDRIGQCLHLLREAVKTAREPIDNQEWDFTTIRGELTDMLEYLQDAQRYNNAVRNSFIELIALIRRLQAAYHDAYEANQVIVQQSAEAYRQGQLDLLHRVVVEMEQSDFEQIVLMARAIFAAKREDPFDLAQQLDHLLTAIGVENTHQ